ncbi:MAG: inositol monophosphatase [Saprospirales bacterium]|nr:MAG: inositol monophosphatase [Saprospirales bacterium]
MEKFSRGSELENPLSKIVSDTALWIRNEAVNFDSASVEFKGRNDLVSDIDRKAQEMLVVKLAKLMPGSGFLTEEDITEDEIKEFTWVIDPLDGTTNYVHGLPIFSVSVSLKLQDRVVMGAIAEPNLNEVFTAYLGGGARLNGRPIRTSKTVEIGSALIATGFPYRDFSQLGSYLELLNYFLVKTRGVRRLGSAAIDLAYTAAGRFDGFYEYGLNEWDVSAGTLILSEAGGKVSCWNDSPQFVTNKTILATNSHLHNDMLKVIRKVFG